VDVYTLLGHVLGQNSDLNHTLCLKPLMPVRTRLGQSSCCGFACLGHRECEFCALVRDKGAGVAKRES